MKEEFIKIDLSKATQKIIAFRSDIRTFDKEFDITGANRIKIVMEQDTESLEKIIKIALTYYNK